MTEYEELREKIFRTLENPFTADLRRKRPFTEARLRLADEILSIIADTLKRNINDIFDHCYTEGSPDYPDLMIFQRQKAVNEIMALVKEIKKPEELSKFEINRRKFDKPVKPLKEAK